jgi:hypothetical protein
MQESRCRKKKSESPVTGKDLEAPIASSWRRGAGNLGENSELEERRIGPQKNR